MPEEVSSDADVALRLTPTSYVVLGLVDVLEPDATPYRLKQVMARSVADFHPVPHTTFYVEPARLAKGGYLEEVQEERGRRRKSYSLTDKGRRALTDWVADTEAEATQLRSPAMLKVFLGADPEPLARAALAHHQALLANFQNLLAVRGDHLQPGPRRALETGISYHRWWISAWERLRES